MIDLSRAEGIGDKKHRDKELVPNYDVDLCAGKNIDVLVNGDLVFVTYHIGKRVKGEWRFPCGFCKEFSLAPIIEYRCLNCKARVIKVDDEQHKLYSHFVDLYKQKGYKSHE